MECSLSIGGNLRKALRPAKYKLLKLPLVFAAARDLWGLAVRKFVTRWGKPVFHREIRCSPTGHRIDWMPGDPF